MKKSIKKNNKNSIIINIIILGIVLFTIINTIIIVNTKIYCSLDLKDKCNQLQNILLLVFYLFGFITYGYYKLFKEKQIKSIMLVSFLIMVSIILSYHFSKKLLLNKLVKSDEFVALEKYYSNNLNEYYKIYDNKIGKCLEQKDIECSIKYIDLYDEYNVNESILREYKYEAILLMMKDINYYKTGKKYLIELKNYKDSNNLIKDLMYNYIISSEIDKVDYEEIISNIEELDNYKNVNDNAYKLLYDYANYIQYSNKEIALKVLEYLDDYNDSKDLYKKIYYYTILNGTWFSIEKWIINDNVCYKIFTTSNQINANKKYKCEFKNNKLYIYNDDTNTLFNVYEYKNDKLYNTSYKNDKRLYEFPLQKINNSTTLPTTKIILEPAIGMTAEQVRNSTWGNPNKINKSTYSWGTTEQWVYSGYRYIYFKNGIVTSISE